MALSQRAIARELGYFNLTVRRDLCHGGWMNIWGGWRSPRTPRHPSKWVANGQNDRLSTSCNRANPKV